MKKFLYLLLLGAMATACTNEVPGEEGNNPGAGNENQAEVSAYLSVQLVAPGALKARAETNDGQYEYGTSDENYVNEVRFYFFDDDDNAVGVRKNPIYDANVPANGPEYFSYIDWDPTPSDNTGNSKPGGDTETDVDNSGNLQDGTVEKILQVTMTLTANNGVFPTQVVAIVNPSDYIKSENLLNPTPALSDIQDFITDNLTNLTTSNFIMSNSVYINESNAITIGQPISKDNLGYTQAEAQAKPMIVYVERAVARFNLVFNPTSLPKDQTTLLSPVTLLDGTVLYPTYTNITTEDRVYEGEQAPEGQLKNTPVYAKFFGWAVTSTPTKSYVLKQINPEWGASDNLFGVVNEPWYIPGYHRSYWAINPTLSDDPTQNDYIWYTYNELSGENAENPSPNPPIQQLSNLMTVTKTYMQENANPTDGEAAQTEYPTKIIFAAQLTDGSGNALEFTEWNGMYFTLQGLKNLAASMLDMYYIEPGTGTGDVQPVFVPISPDQITFQTYSSFKGLNPIFNESNLNYTVIPTLTSAEGTEASNPTENAMGLQWYHLNDNIKFENAKPEDFTAISSSSINNYMFTVFGDAKIWNNGYTYFFLTINHLGALGKPGYFGVVRNHVYLATVSSMVGLGTPVWDPNEKIYPEKPEDDNNKLSAQIKVLSWRLVTDSYEFDW